MIQDIDAIAAFAREKKIIFHVDAAQACGKIPIDLEKTPIDLMSMSAHKVHGPKGIGALFVRRKPRVRLNAQMHGGGHERGFRSGTLPTHQIVGMGEAYHLAGKHITEDYQKAAKLRNLFLQELEGIEEIYINGDLEQRSPYNINVSFNYVEGESLIMAVKELAVSSGSACTSASLEPSYVLRALGRDDELAHSSLRISTSRFTTEEEIRKAARLIKEKVEKLRQLSPLWELYQEGVNLKTIQWTDH